MSIFKESFKDFVRKQIKIREAIISHGSDPNDSRTNSPKVDLSNLGGPKDLPLPSHAFYTNTVNRQCTIRMSSGVDLKTTNELVVDNSNPMERKDDLVNEGLALRYVLEGGVPMIDRSVKQTSKENGDGSITDKKDYQFKQALRSGFAGASKNRFGQTYGDPSIRANPEIDEYGESYGIVPMPGITSANIRTASAYGGIREAKVEFVCHNQRQLEILELLYMRPGYPVLLEWGWTPYINNEGERESDFPPIAQWWDQNSSVEEINRLVIQRKIDTGGNYDAVVGLVKNFNYTARPDGGFNCTTELTGVGETIEALKGRSDMYNADEGYFETALEKFLKSAIEYSSYANSISLDQNELAVAQLQDDWSIADEVTFGLLSNENITKGLNWVKRKTLSTLESYGLYEPPTDFFDFIDLNWLKTHSSTPEIYDQYKEAWSEDNDTRNAVRQKVLNNFMLRKDQDLVISLDEDGDSQLGKSITSRGVYLRLDFFCHVMNQHIIEKNENGDSPKLNLKTDTIVHEDREIKVNPETGETLTEGKHIEPFAYCTSTISKNLKDEFRALYDKAVDPERKNGWFGYGDSQFDDFYGEDNASSINDSLSEIKDLITDSDLTQFNINNFDDLVEGDRIDISIDPTVCLFPHQLKFLQSKASTLADTVDPFYKRVPPQFAYDGLGNPKDKNRSTRYDEYIKLCNYNIEKEKPGVYDRQIGHIFVNVEHMLRVFQSMRYDIDLSRGLADAVRANLDFNLFDFFKQILKDINNACGGQHKFTLQPDHERPHIMNIVDLIYQPEESIDTDIKEGKIIELNIQSNNSVFRDFQYTSTVPSSLMATIGVVAQNPDAISDLEQSTYSALNVNIRQRFAQKFKAEKPRVYSALELETLQKQKQEAQQAAKDALFAERTAFDISLLDTFKSFISLQIFYNKAIRGQYSKTDSDGNPKHSEEIGKQKQNLKTILNEVSKLSTRHLKDGKYLDNTEFRRGDVKRAPDKGVSDIIPLKFQAVMDGIGGIVIGSTFKVNKSRLPLVYRKTGGRNILFICMTEEQNITAGQDWTTSISGQLTIIGEDPTTQNTGAGKGKGKGTGGGSVGAAFGAAGTRTLIGKTENLIQEEREPVRENKEIEVDEAQETQTQEEQKLNKQDQCPPGQYFDEELGICVLEGDASIIEEEPKKAKAKERYKQWRKQVIDYANNGEGLNYYNSELFSQADTAYTNINASKQFTVIYFAFFDNMIVNAKNIKTLSTYKGGSIGPELIELFNNDEELKNKGIQVTNSNLIFTIPELVPTIEKIHNIEDPKMMLFDTHRTFISKAFEYIVNAREGANNPDYEYGKYVPSSANESVVFDYKDYYGPSDNEPAEPNNIVEVYRSIEIISPSVTSYEGGTLPNQPTPLQEYVYEELSVSIFNDLEGIKEEIDILIEDWESDTGETANV